MTEEQLVGVWIIDLVQGTRFASVRYHFEKHGPIVGAADIAEYVRLALRFRAEVRSRSGPGQPVIGRTPGVRCWKKLGYFIHIAPNDEIVSFGTTG